VVKPIVEYALSVEKENSEKHVAVILPELGGATMVLPPATQQPLFSIEDTLVLSGRSTNQHHQRALVSQKLGKFLRKTCPCCED
jgi:hypothetical protein